MAVKNRDPGLKAALARMRATELARHLNCTTANVCKWEKIPLERVAEVAAATGLHPVVLRPDYIGPLMPLLACQCRSERAV